MFQGQQLTLKKYPEPLASSRQALYGHLAEPRRPQTMPPNIANYNVPQVKNKIFKNTPIIPHIEQSKRPKQQHKSNKILALLSCIPKIETHLTANLY